MSKTRTELTIVVTLLLLVLLLRLPAFYVPFENDSGDHAYHAHLILRGEPLYGEHHPDHHMPGVFYTYALAFALFGESVAAIKGVLLVWIAATVYLIYRLGRRVANRRVGVIAAVAAALLFATWELSAFSARTELFLVLFDVGAVLLLAGRLPGGGDYGRFLGIGLLAGLAFLFKANYIIAPAGLVAVALLWDLWMERQWKAVLGRGATAVLGVVLITVPVFLYFAAVGLLDRFLQVFQIGEKYLTARQHPLFTGPEHHVLVPLAVLARSNAVLLLLAIAGWLFLPLTRRQRSHAENGRLALLMAWFVLAFVETNVSNSYLQHYYVMFIAPLVLLAAWFVDKLARDVERKWGQVGETAVIASLVALVVLINFLPNFTFYKEFGRYALGQQNYDDFLVNGLPDGAGMVALEMEDLAAYVQTHTAPDDTIYFWSNFMELYFLADRHAVIDTIWPIAVSVTGADSLKRDQIFNATLIIIDNYTIVGVETMPDWLAAGLAEKYELASTVDDRLVYRRRDEVN
ncbi:MAG: glycosyltransferase family 39 protein [Ardenticatenaceae bacterium]|nr:glycosyltransferase family 39 protein [Ardenticatenaceae bacterium]